VAAGSPGNAATRKEREMNERNRTMDERHRQWVEYEDLRHAYHRTRIEMAWMQKRARETGKMPVYFLEAEDDWTPIPMDADFWRMVIGGLDGLRRHLCHAGVLRDND
jgi:hypothetical protein